MSTQKLQTEGTVDQPADLPTTPQDLLAMLDVLEISYSLHRHEPMFTVADGEEIEKDIPGTHCRNLFLRDKKKNMALIVAANETALDMKKLAPLIDMGRLSFGSKDRLWQYLGIRQGSVCPFCIVNDTDKDVMLVLDAYMMDQDIVNYHPLDNAMTIGLKPADLIRFIEAQSHPYKIVDLSRAKPDEE